MTAHILITLIILILFSVVATKIVTNKPFPWKIITFILFAILPISFSGMTVIAHFLFETSSDNLLWFIILYPLLWIFAGFHLYKIKTNLYKFLLGILWAILGVWYFFALSQSAYESGATPVVSDTIELISYWTSIQIFILVLFALLIDFNLKNKNIFSKIFTTVFLIVYCMIIFSSFPF